MPRLEGGDSWIVECRMRNGSQLTICVVSGGDTDGHRRWGAPLDYSKSKHILLAV